MVYNDFLLQILLVSKQPLEVMVKSRKLVTKKFIFKFNKVKRFCHLLKMDSIRGFSRILYNPLRLVRVFRSPILEKTSWWLLLYVLEALLFQNTSKWLLLSSLRHRAIFFSKNFYLKSHSEKHVPSFSLPWWKKIPSLFFIMFSWLLFTSTLFKNFSLPTKLKHFDFFNPIPGKGVVLTFPIYLGKYLTNSA